MELLLDELGVLACTPGESPRVSWTGVDEAVGAAVVIYEMNEAMSSGMEYTASLVAV